MKMNIHRAERKDFEALMEMALLLWPGDQPEQLKKDIKEILSSKRQAVFICQDEQGNYAGFINVSTRREYVPGVTSFPIGYVEGILVRAAFRRQGIGRKLFESGEKWALEKGCQQMASDTWLWNTASQEFHKNLGFMEEDRLVFYIKRIDVSQ